MGKEALETQDKVTLRKKKTPKPLHPKRKSQGNKSWLRVLDLCGRFSGLLVRVTTGDWRVFSSETGLPVDILAPIKQGKSARRRLSNL
jgi:hypothetical protein